VAASRQTRPRGGRALDPPLRGRARRRRGVQRLCRASRRRAIRRRGKGSDSPGRVQPRDDAAVHRLEPRQPLQGRARGGRVRDMSAPIAVKPEIDAEAVAAELENRTAPEAIEWMFETFGQSHYIACSFQKTSSVTAHLATQVNSDARFFY